MLKNLTFWAIALALATLSGAVAFGAITKKNAPELTLGVAPINGFAAEAAATALVRASFANNLGKFPDQLSSESTALALQAFTSEPVTPHAVAVLALSHTGDVRLELMNEAFKLSRRHKLVTTWLIANSASQNDVSGTLEYYDTILRTSSSAVELVIPVMANAMTDEKLVEPVAQILSDSPPWAGQFWTQVVLVPEALGNAAALRKLLYKTTEPADIYQDKRLIRSLVRNQKFKEAEALYVVLSRSGEVGDLIRNSEFRSKPNYPPIDWEVYSTGEYGATISGERLNLSAIPSSGGLFARQLVKLPNGKLRLKVKFNQQISENANMFIEIFCAQDISRKPEKIKLPLRNSVVVRTIVNQQQSCEYYWISISGRSSEIGDGFDSAITSVSLKPELKK